MSIASELTALQTNLTAAYDAVNDKGGTIPSDKNTTNLAAAIASIATGFSPTEIGMTAAACGTIVNKYTITHDLGVIPKIFVLYCDVTPQKPSSGIYLMEAIKIQTGNVISSSAGMESGLYFAFTSGYHSGGSIRRGSGCIATPGLSIGNIYSITGSNSGTDNNFYMATTSKINVSLYVGSTNASLDPNATYKWLALG